MAGSFHSDVQPVVRFVFEGVLFGLQTYQKLENMSTNATIVFTRAVLGTHEYTRMICSKRTSSCEAPQNARTSARETHEVFRAARTGVTGSPEVKAKALPQLFQLRGHP